MDFIFYTWEKSPTTERTNQNSSACIRNISLYVKRVFYTYRVDGNYFIQRKQTLSPTKTDDAFNDGKKYVQQCFQHRVVNSSFCSWYLFIINNGLKFYRHIVAVHDTSKMADVMFKKQIKFRKLYIKLFYNKNIIVNSLNYSREEM